MKSHGGFRHSLIMAAAVWVLENKGWSVATEHRTTIPSDSDNLDTDTVTQTVVEVDVFATKEPEQSKRNVPGDLHEYEDVPKERIAIEVACSTHRKDRENLKLLGKHSRNLADCLLDGDDAPDELGELKQWVTKELPIPGNL